MSLFDESGMRRTAKAVFYENFEILNPPTPSLDDQQVYVIDGGYLLHRVIWQNNKTLKEIIQIYVQYLC